uniref:TF-B3 domain-containing protein n=2 Tax=Chenopodium quinoa TaxID=63459 RepID=A0A803LRE2_CHEQI
RIPEEYVNKNGQRFAYDYVRLRVGKDGRVWRVEVYKESDQIWLTKGWERVVMNYSIKGGDFLLFKYDERDSMFQLNIFDTTGFEIEYDQQVEQISSASEEMVLIDDNDHDHISLSEDDDVAVYEPMDPTDVESRVEAYKTKNPHFKVIMQPSYVSNVFRYSFPIRHVRKHLRLLEVQQIQLKATDREGSYPVRLNLHNKNSQAAVGFGWKKFVLENDLQVGDGCVFELICPQTNAYKVTIFRVPRF